jgi:hypothetical protein
MSVLRSGEPVSSDRLTAALQRSDRSPRQPVVGDQEAEVAGVVIALGSRPTFPAGHLEPSGPVADRVIEGLHVRV